MSYLFRECPFFAFLKNFSKFFPYVVSTKTKEGYSNEKFNSNHDSNYHDWNWM